MDKLVNLDKIFHSVSIKVSHYLGCNCFHCNASQVVIKQTTHASLVVVGFVLAL